MYTPKHFAPHEFVPPKIFHKRGDKSLQLMDDRILITADALRDRYGRIVINNWYWGGDRQWSGLRTSDSPYGSELSQHRFGRALDMIMPDADVDEVSQDIMNDPELFPYITSMELGTSWLHIDCRNCNRILTFYP